MKKLTLEGRITEDNAVEVWYFGKWRHLGWTRKGSLPSEALMRECERIFRMNSGISDTVSLEVIICGL